MFVPRQPYEPKALIVYRQCNGFVLNTFTPVLFCAANTYVQCVSRPHNASELWLFMLAQALLPPTSKRWVRGGRTAGGEASMWVWSVAGHLWLENIAWGRGCLPVHCLRTAAQSLYKHSAGHLLTRNPQSENNLTQLINLASFTALPECLFLVFS